MGMERTSNHRSRIAGIRRLLEEVSKDDISMAIVPARSAVDRPEWLPEEWDMKTKTRKDGRVDRYYISPITGTTCRSKPEVFRHLDPVNDEQAPSPTAITPYSGGFTLGPHGGTKHLLAALEDYPLAWLPTGWILELVTSLNEDSEATDFKCYYDPFTGSRFYSKQGVLRNLKAGKHHGATLSKRTLKNSNPLVFYSSRRGNNNMGCIHKVITQFDFNPSGLPQGWIKEMRISKTKTTQKMRRDSFYIDTDTGYAFRSNRDALRYLENGATSRPAFIIEESHLSKARSSMNGCLINWLEPIKRIKLKKRKGLHYARKKRKSNVRTLAVIHDPPQSPSSLPESENECQAIVPFDSEGFAAHPINNMEPESGIHLEESGMPGLEIPAQEVECKMTSKKYQRRKWKVKCGPSSCSTIATTVDVNQTQSVKRKATDNIASPLQASKRLAGIQASPVSELMLDPQITKPSQAGEPQIEAELISELMLVDQSRNAKPSQPDEPLIEAELVSDFMVVDQPDEPHQTVSTKDSDPAICDNTETRVDQVMQGQKVDMPKEPTYEDKSQTEQVASQEQQVNQPKELPLSDVWSDPSIEFAVKTLTGDIPVLDDTTALKEYYLKQLMSVHKLLPSAQPASVNVASVKDSGRMTFAEKGKELKQWNQKFV